MVRGVSEWIGFLPARLVRLDEILSSVPPWGFYVDQGDMAEDYKRASDRFERDQDQRRAAAVE